MGWFKRHHEELHNVAHELHDAVEPPGIDEPTEPVDLPVDVSTADSDDTGAVAHAGGHRHLAPPPQDRPSRRRFMILPARMNRGGDERRL